MLNTLVQVLLVSNAVYIAYVISADELGTFKFSDTTAIKKLCKTAELTSYTMTILLLANIILNFTSGFNGIMNIVCGMLYAYCWSLASNCKKNKGKILEVFNKRGRTEEETENMNMIIDYGTIFYDNSLRVGLVTALIGFGLKFL
jgi:hypothetical protein